MIILAIFCTFCLAEMIMLRILSAADRALWPAVMREKENVEIGLQNPEQTESMEKAGETENTRETCYEWILADAKLLDRYRERNKDVVGVITVRDSVLRHPLMQSPERGESFYLNHDLDLNHNFHGIPFLTLKSDLLRDGGNNLIYGHNIIWTEPRDIFCDFVNYEDIEYYKNHPIIEVITQKGTVRYLIFSYAIMDTADSDAFVYWESTEWETEEEFHSYMEQMEARNWLDTKIPYTINDSFLTISTCSKELAHSGTNRMVVMAKRLAVGEEYQSYVKEAKQKENPYLPEKLRKLMK